MPAPDFDHDLPEVPVHAAVLRATANLLELLGGFFTSDPAFQLGLGSYIIDRHGEANGSDLIKEAVVMLSDLGDAADLLHKLADDQTPS
jgi:hypothetical protein